jgi:hypothetical protein
VLLIDYAMVIDAKENNKDQTNRRVAQLMADAAAKGREIQTKIIGEDEAKFSHDKLVGKDIRWMFFQPSYEEILHETRGEFLA